MKRNSLANSCVAKTDNKEQFFNDLDSAIEITSPSDINNNIGYDSNQIPFIKRPRLNQLSNLKDGKQLRSIPNFKAKKNLVYGKTRSTVVSNQPPSPSKKGVIQCAATTDTISLNSTVSPPIGHVSKENSPDRLIQKAEERLSLALKMDDFFLSLSSENLFESIESFVQQNLNAGHVVYWQEVVSIQHFYSYKLNLSVRHYGGILGYSFATRSITIIPVANLHESYDPEIDGHIINPTTSLVLFPLFDLNNNLAGIVEVSKKANDSEVSKSDLFFIENFQKKFRIFSQWILQSNLYTELAIDLIHLMELDQFILLFQRKMHELFQCRKAEIWSLDTEKKSLLCFSNDIKEVDTNQAGLVGEVLKRDQIFNCYLNSLQSSYRQEIDGEEKEPFIAMPFSDAPNHKSYVIAVRGQKTQNLFTQVDEEKLTKLTPFIISSFTNSLYLSEKIEVSSGNERFVESLLKVLPSFGVKKRPVDFLKVAMGELKYFTKADRVTYFELDKEKSILRSLHSDGLKERIQVPIGKGHCGVAAKKGTIMNTANAYEDKFFDSAFDKFSQYLTKSILSVPIINPNGVVSALVQLLNKQDEKPFSKSDIGATQVFGTVCNCIVSNSIQISELNDVARRLEGLNSALKISDNNREDFQRITEALRTTLQCECTTLYSFDEAALILRPVANGGKRQFTEISSLKGISNEILESKESFFTNDAKNHVRLLNELDSERRIMISLVVVPILTRNGKAIGIFRAINKRGLFDTNDVRSVERFAHLISLLYENQKLRQIIENGPAQLKISKWVNDGEIGSCNIPEMMRLPDNQRQMMTEIDFNTLDWNNNGLFQITFYAFGGFGLLTKLKIENDSLFAFLFELKQEYNRYQTSFHNWKRAVEMLQFVMYSLNATQMDKTLQPRDVISLILAVLCCHMAHDGSSNALHIRNESPIGIALNRENILESNCCIRLIELMSKNNKTNILKNMANEDQKYVWRFVIRLIMNSSTEKKSTDVESIAEKLSYAPLDMKNEVDRFSLTLLLFRAALYSTHCRPFLISQKWHDLETEDILHLGDLEENAKVQYSNVNNCREINNKSAHAINSLKDKVIPLYEIITKGIPDLKGALSIAQTNLKTWNHINKTKAQNDEQSAV